MTYKSRDTCFLTAFYHLLLLCSSPTTPKFAQTTCTIIATVALAEAGLLSLAAAARLLGSDLIYGWYAPKDFCMFQDLARRMACRGNGMGMYFSLIDPTRERFPAAPGVSVLQTLRTEEGMTPRMEGGVTPRQSAPVGSSERADELWRESVCARSCSHSHSILHLASWNRVNHHHNLSHHHHEHHQTLHHALLPVLLALHSSRFENVVGVFESQKYLNLEATKLRNLLVEDYMAQTTVLLNNRWGAF